MLEIHDDQLAIEAKGIYSIEKFIVARRLMYWQVYLHKTVVSAEVLLINILKRAKELSRSGKKLFATPAFSYFLNNEVTRADFEKDRSILELFTQLDDSDIGTSIKVWSKSEDKILSDLCSRMINRKLFKIILQKEVEVLDGDTVETLSARILEQEHSLYIEAIRKIVLGRGFSV